MGIFNLIKEAKIGFKQEIRKRKEKHLIDTIKKTQELEHEAKLNKAYIENVKKQDKFKEINKEAYRLRNPILTKISDNVRNKVKTSFNERKKNNKIKINNNNVWTSTGNNKMFTPQKNNIFTTQVNKKNKNIWQK